MRDRVRSLQYLVIQFVAKNIDYWLEFLPEDSCNEYLYLINPFEILGIEVTQSLLNHIVTSLNFKRKHLHLLLHGNFTIVDLSSLTSSSLVEASLKILMMRCKKLVSLTVRDPTSKYPPAQLNSLPQCFKGLRFLDLTSASIRGDFLLNLVENCPLLEFLHLGDTKQVKDCHFQAVCKCSSLKSLSLGHAYDLSMETVKGIVLALPKLFSLSFPFSSLQFCEESNMLPSEVLDRLDLSMSNLQNGCMDILTRSFKSLTTLNVSNNPDVTTDCLDALSTVENFKSLNLSFTGIEEWNDALRKFILCRGGTFRSLDLSGVRYIDSSVIGRACPLLEVLTMLHCPKLRTEYILSHQCQCISCQSLHCPREMSLAEHCKNLIKFHVGPEDTNYSPQSTFRLGCLIRNASSLQHLTLSRIPNFSDEDIVSLGELMNMSSLIHLDLPNNKNITDKHIYFVLKNYAKLETMNIKGCDIISREYIDLVNFTNLSNLNVNISW